MGLLGDDEHPDQAATALHKIFDILLILIGVGLIIVSAYYMNALKAASFFAIILLIVGIGVIGISIVGLFGSGYYKGGEKEGRLLCLRIFWLAALLFAVVMFIFGGICLVSQETIQSYVLVYYGEFTQMTNQFDGQAGSIMQQLTALMNNFKVLGGVGVAVGLFLLGCFICSSYIMGVRIFLLTCAMFGSIGIAVIGGVIIGLSAYFTSYTEVMAKISQILFGGVILGVISIVVGAFGMVAYWLHKKLPIILKIFTVVVLVVAVAYLVLGIISFALSGPLNDKTSEGYKSLKTIVDTHCGVSIPTPAGGRLDATKSPCYSLVKNSITFECQKVRNEEMSGDICPWYVERKDEEKAVCTQKPPPPCCCGSDTESYIAELKTKENFLEFSMVTNKKSVVSNYKILGMLSIVTAILLLFITGTLFISCCFYTPEELNKDDDDKYEWVYEDESEEDEEVNKDKK